MLRTVSTRHVKRRNRKQRQEITAYAYDKRGRLISVGKNSYTKSHPMQRHFAKLCGKPDAIFLHAEIACLLKAGRQVVHRLEIFRFNKHGESVLAAPCDICQRAIKAWGVKHIRHT